MRRMLIAAMMFIATSTAMPTPSAEAGPLLDWWRSRPRLFSRNADPAVTAFMPAPGSCQTTCPVQTQRVTVNYVPQTRYRSTWVQTPITSYRPTTTTDPLTGCQVTCVKPCTTYQWSLRRIPSTTYRPVYQTQSVQMPAVTSAGSCNTCSIVQPAYPIVQNDPYAGMNYAGQSNAAMTMPQASTGNPHDPALNGYNAGNYNAGNAAADLQPSISPNDPYSTNRVIIEPTLDANGNPIGSSILNGSSAPPINDSGASPDPTTTPLNNSSPHMPQRIDSSDTRPNQHSPILDPAPGVRRIQPSSAPPLLPTDQNTASVSLHRPWDYSPVQLAVYQEPVSNQPRLLPTSLTVPVQNMPVQNMPVQNMPVQNRSLQGVPAQTAPSPSSPASNRGWHSMSR